MRTPLIGRLNAVRRRHAAVAVGTAAAGVVGLGVLALAGGMLLDRWFELSRSGRAALLWVDGIVLLGVAVWRGGAPVARGPDVEAAALWVERAVPAFGSRLISAVQFVRRPLDAGASAAMAAAVVLQAEAAAEGVDFAAVVSVRPLRRMAAVTVGVVAVVVGGVAVGGRTGVALAERAVLMPVPFPHRTRVTVTGGDLTVARGGPVTLSATAAGVVPSEGLVVVRYGSGATAELPAVGNGARFDRPIENVQEGFAYRFEIGDGRSDERRVRVVTRPAVLGVRCRVTPPAYTGLAAAERSPWDLSVPAGGRLRLTVSASGASGGRVRFVGTKVEVPLVGSGATWSTPDATVPAGATGFTVGLVSAEGMASRDGAVYRIETVPDRPPTVRLVTPAGDQTVTPVARPAVTVEATDDYGVARLSLRYRVTRAGQAVAVDDDPNGLTGTYGGATRTDPEIDFGWAATPLPAGVGPGAPVRWVGSLRPAVSDRYTFDLRFTGGGQLTVDGRAVRPGEAAELVAGRLYPITLTGTVVSGGEARLSWRGRRVPEQVVPHGCLYRRTTPYAPPADADGLVGYWPLDDVATGFAHDVAGSADGTVFDAAGVPGRIGGAATFHPAPNRKQRIEVPWAAVMQYRADESYTLAAWVDVRRATGAWQAIVNQGHGGGSGYGLAIDPGGQVVATTAAGNVVGPVLEPGWHHVAVVQDGAAGFRTLYVDGKVAVIGRPHEAGGGGLPMCFGNVRDGGQPLDGSVDDLRLYGRAVPGEQVAAMFADARAARVPTPAEVGGAAGGAAGTVSLPGPTSPAARRRLAWDLSSLPSPPAVGDTVEVWAEAADNNTATGPGVAASDHRRLRVVDAAEKRRELVGRLGDYLGRVQAVSDDQGSLAAEIGKMAGPTTSAIGSKKE